MPREATGQKAYRTFAPYFKYTGREKTFWYFVFCFDRDTLCDWLLQMVQVGGPYVQIQALQQFEQLALVIDYMFKIP